MPRGVPSDLQHCSFITSQGLCGRQCYGTRCFRHKGAKATVYCLGGCEKGTRSASGYCKSCDGGRLRQRAYMKDYRQRKGMDSFIESLLEPTEEELWDKYIEDLISNFDGSGISQPNIP